MPPIEAGPEIQGDAKPKKLRLDTDNPFTGLRPDNRACLKVGVDSRCTVEMEYLTPEDAKALNLPPDTRMALHKCVRPKSLEGEYVPVKSPEEALAASEEFCDCVKRNSVSARRKCSRRKE